MSTLKVNTVQHNTSGFNNVVQFTDGAGTQNGTLCRAWVNFDGTFGTSPFTTANGGIRAEFNVNSVTDNGTGSYTVNFSNAMPDANYSAVANVSSETDANNTNPTGAVDRAAASCRVDSESSGGSQFDAALVDLIVFR